MNVIRTSGVSSYNPLTGKGDTQGKNYLLDLFHQDFPVIPSIDKVEDINFLPSSDYYWVKPKYGADGSGAQKVAKDELPNTNLSEYIIQPYIENRTALFSTAYSQCNTLFDKAGYDR